MKHFQQIVLFQIKQQLSYCLLTFCFLINFFPVKIIHSPRVKLFYATANTNNTKSKEKGTSVSCSRNHTDKAPRKAPLFGYALVGSPLFSLLIPTSLI